MTDALGAVWIFPIPPLTALGVCLVGRLPVPGSSFFFLWIVDAVVGVATSADQQWWPGTVACGASGLLGLILWWWSRRKRKRSLRALGNKARARLAAMIRNMPERRPVLRPVPQSG